MPPVLPLGGEVESTAAAAAASAANAAAHAAAAAVMNQPVASVQASTETMEQVSFAVCACLGGVCQSYTLALVYMHAEIHTVPCPVLPCFFRCPLTTNA